MELGELLQIRPFDSPRQTTRAPGSGFCDRTLGVLEIRCGSKPPCLDYLLLLGTLRFSQQKANHSICKHGFGPPKSLRCPFGFPPKQNLKQKQSRKPRPNSLSEWIWPDKVWLPLTWSCKKMTKVRNGTQGVRKPIHQQPPKKATLKKPCLGTRLHRRVLRNLDLRLGAFFSEDEADVGRGAKILKF